MKYNILVTGIGGPTPRSIAKSVNNLNSNHKIIGIDANPKASGFFIPDLVSKYYVSPRMDHPDYWPFIYKLIKEENIDFAFVQPEAEVVGWGIHYQKYGYYPCPVLIPPVELSVTLMDKSLMADLLKDTAFIPKTMKINQSNPCFDEIESKIGYPCWIRAIKGSGGLGSLKLTDRRSFMSWLKINDEIEEFTVSEFLPGRHLATEMLYYMNEYLKGASLECVEYVMARIAPSKVTGNTSFGRFLNEDRILRFCDECIQYTCNVLNVKPHGVLSFDLKEDAAGNLKVTEVNIRHMAYTGVLASAGFNLIEDSVNILTQGNTENFNKQPFFKFDKPYVFLRDVDIEPVLLESEDIFQNRNK